MRKRIRGWFQRRKGGSLSIDGKGSADMPRVPGVVEALEPRMLLSGVVLGDLPVGNGLVDAGDYKYSVNLPELVLASSNNNLAGNVFSDADGDGLWDPNEYALQGATVFADVDGDGQLGADEKSAITSSDGRFYLNDTPTGSYEVRVLMPDGYRASVVGSDSALVAVTEDSGIKNLRFGLKQTGYDLGVAISTVSLPKKLKTGTRVTLPVILTNHGEEAVPAGSVKLRVSLLGSFFNFDSREPVAVVKYSKAIGAGESVKF